MSSFLVSESTLQDAVTCFAGFEGKSSTRAAEDLDVLGRRLWQLNCDALYDRYGSKAVNMVCTAEECADFRWRVAILDDRDTAKMCHHLKALECLIYQCSEGDCVKSITNGGRVGSPPFSCHN